MERPEAIAKLKILVGKDLRVLAESSGITIFKYEVSGPTARLNKGWAGHTIERFLGLPLNSSQAPNFGSWELKVVPVKRLKSGQLVMKETMAITMLDPVEVAQKEFEDSHIFSKLRKIVVLARIFESKAEGSSLEAVSKPPQGDHEAGDVEEGLVDGQLAVITDSQVAEVSQPSICPFNLPTFAVTT